MNDPRLPNCGNAFCVGRYRHRSASHLWCLVLATAVTGFLSATTLAGTILGSKHDLSVKGGGDIKAASETEVCLFCHTPHRALKDGPLWSHSMSLVTDYVPYDSSTIKAVVGQPSGASRLCLSCHDGTVALGMVVTRSENIEMQNSVTTMPAGRSNIGTDLSDDHPVSFKYDTQLANDSGELKNPASLIGRVRLDHGGEMQCTSCHDPHDNQFGAFLVMSNTASILCQSCHAKQYWQDSVHRTSAAQWNHSGRNPWPDTPYSSVSANACGNCHATHGAGMKSRLLVFDKITDNCSACHNGNVASKNVLAEFDKPSAHRTIADTSKVHDPTEDLINSDRHVECVDCHNPHASKASSAIAPTAGGTLAGVAGISSGRAVVDPVVREYELCYRCHADSENRGEARVTRLTVETNTRHEFSTGNKSYHPVEAAGKNADVPSLITPWTTSSLTYCTDCHNSDTGPGSGGTGPNGPHGSINVPLLERNLTTIDYGDESGYAYALCYKCHDRSNIMADKSFTKHHTHVADKQAACTTCHDSHGVAGATHLINFNATYVTKSSSLRGPEFIDDGRFRGTCYLTCHGKDHNPLSYAP